MNYEKALKLWAVSKLSDGTIEEYDHDSIRVELEFEKSWNSGCDTCGYGADDDKVFIKITGYKKNGTYRDAYNRRSTEIDRWEFNMAEMIREICDVAGGSINS